MRGFIRTAVLSAIIGLISFGCITSVRYSPAEIKDFPKEVQDQIKERAINLGMSMAQIRYAWGGPSEVMVLEPSKEGKYREEWVYRGFLYFKTSLVFTDGTLTEIVSAEPGIIKYKSTESFTAPRVGNGAVAK